jgi:phage/plasmid primase-like uncharacterized protein
MKWLPKFLKSNFCPRFLLIGKYGKSYLPMSGDSKSCPFCGGEGKLRMVHFKDGDVWFHAMCGNCGLMSGSRFETKELAEIEWNGRI